MDVLISSSPLVAEQGKRVQRTGTLAKIADESCPPTKETLTGAMSLPAIFPALVYQCGWMLED